MEPDLSASVISASPSLKPRSFSKDGTQRNMSWVGAHWNWVPKKSLPLFFPFNFINRSSVSLISGVIMFIRTQERLALMISVKVRLLDHRDEPFKQLLRHWILEVIFLERTLPAIVAVASLEPFNVTAQDPKSVKSVDTVALKSASLWIWKLSIILGVVSECIYSRGGRYFPAPLYTRQCVWCLRASFET